MTDFPSRTRLVLQISLDATDLTAINVPALTAAGDIACVIFHVTASASSTALGEKSREFQDAGVAVLVANDHVLAKRIAADGVHLSAAPEMLKAYAEARSAWPDGIIGTEAGPGHHNALLLGEQGADYLAFQLPDQSDDLKWWAEAIEIPSVAIGTVTVEQAAELPRHGVEFVTVGCDCRAIAAVEEAVVKETLAGAGN